MVDQPRKEKSSFLNLSYVGLFCVRSQFGMYSLEGFGNAGSSFNDDNILCCIGIYHIMLYYFLFCHALS